MIGAHAGSLTGIEPSLICQTAGSAAMTRTSAAMLDCRALGRSRHPKKPVTPSKAHHADSGGSGIRTQLRLPLLLVASCLFRCNACMQVLADRRIVGPRSPRAGASDGRIMGQFPPGLFHSRAGT